MKTSNKLPLEVQKKIAERLKDLRISAEYTQEDIAKKIKVTTKTYREWEVGKYTKDDTFYYPAIEYDNLFMLADIYHVSIDYLLCRSNCTSVDNHYISLKTGLSDKVIKCITSKNGNTPKQDFLNSFILSEEYIEIEHSLSWIKNDCHNIEVYHPIFENIKAAIKKAENQEEFHRLDNKLQEYASHLEHNGSQIQFLMYQCSLSFGNFLNNIRKSWSNEVCSTLKSLEKPLAGLDSAKEYYKKRILDTN